MIIQSLHVTRGYDVKLISLPEINKTRANERIVKRHLIAYTRLSFLQWYYRCALQPAPQTTGMFCLMKAKQYKF